MFFWYNYIGDEMKRKSLAIFVLTILLFLNISCNASSKEQINSWNSNIIVKKSGDFSVEETISWTVGAQKNGVFRRINKKGFSKIEDIKVMIDGKSLTQDTSAKNGSKDVYNIDETTDYLKINVYTPFESNKTVKFIYNIRDVSRVGQDTGFISYNFFDDQKMDIKNFSANISFEKGPYTGKDVFIHSNSDGKFEVKEGSIKIHANEIPAGDFISLNILYDMSLTELAKTRTDDTYQELLKKEEDSSPKKRPLLFTAISAVLGISVIPFFYKLIKTLKKDKNKKESFVVLSPVEAGYLIKGSSALTRLMEVTLLELENLGALSIEKSTYTTKRGKERANYIIRRLDSSLIEKPYQKYFFEKLFELTDDDLISTKEIMDLRKKNEIKFYRHFEDFNKILNERLVELGIKYKNLKDVKLFVVSSVISVLFLVSSALTLNPIIILIATLFLLFIIILGSASMLRLTPKGDYLLKEYKRIERELKMTENVKEDLSTLAFYAMAFGLPYNKLERFRDEFYPQTFMYALLLSNDNYKKFTESFHIATTGSSTTTGSFTSGSTGATGGGGAGTF